jgi:hypothetical protein
LGFEARIIALEPDIAAALTAITAINFFKQFLPTTSMLPISANDSNGWSSAAPPDHWSRAVATYWECRILSRMSAFVF